jgi:hypothetical protein
MAKIRMISNTFWCWLFENTALALHERGYWMYVKRNDSWEAVQAYSLSKDGPPNPRTITRTEYTQKVETHV